MTTPEKFELRHPRYAEIRSRENQALGAGAAIAGALLAGWFASRTARRDRHAAFKQSLLETRRAKVERIAELAFTMHRAELAGFDHYLLHPLESQEAFHAQTNAAQQDLIFLVRTYAPEHFDALERLSQYTGLVRFRVHEANEEREKSGRISSECRGRVRAALGDLEIAAVDLVEQARNALIAREEEVAASLAPSWFRRKPPKPKPVAPHVREFRERKVELPESPPPQEVTFFTLDKPIAGVFVRECVIHCQVVERNDPSRYYWQLSTATGTHQFRAFNLADRVADPVFQTEVWSFLEPKLPAAVAPEKVQPLRLFPILLPIKELIGRLSTATSAQELSLIDQRLIVAMTMVIQQTFWRWHGVTSMVAVTLPPPPKDGEPMSVAHARSLALMLSNLTGVVESIAADPTGPLAQSFSKPPDHHRPVEQRGFGTPDPGREEGSQKEAVSDGHMDNGPDNK